MQKFLVMMADIKKRKSINLYDNPLTQTYVISKVKTVFNICGSVHHAL